VSTSESAATGSAGLHWPEVRAWLSEHPEHLTGDRELLAQLGLKPQPRNVVEFGPAALSRLEQVVEREAESRKAIEDLARANFVAQAKSHAAVLDLMGARNHADLARRLDLAARTRFDLVCGVIALEKPGAVPFGWRPLDENGVDALIGEDGVARLGRDVVVDDLFGELTAKVKSAALVRVQVGSPARQAVAAFGSAEPDGFTPDMGVELVAFLARVVERTAERWPVL
jgi:uncharacterized protein YigA (DUF484 family)